MIVKELEDELGFKHPCEFSSEVINLQKVICKYFLLQLLQMNKYFYYTITPSGTHLSNYKDIKLFLYA